MGFRIDDAFRMMSKVLTTYKKCSKTCKNLKILSYPTNGRISDRDETLNISSNVVRIGSHVAKDGLMAICQCHGFGFHSRLVK